MLQLTMRAEWERKKTKKARGKKKGPPFWKKQASGGVSRIPAKEWEAECGLVTKNSNLDNRKRCQCSSSRLLFFCVTSPRKEGAKKKGDVRMTSRAASAYICEGGHTGVGA